MKQKRNIFKNKFFVVLFASICAVAWGNAFPLIKMGVRFFAIAPLDTGAKTLFAGIRFFVAGLIVLLIAKLTKRSFAVSSKKDAFWLLLFGMVNTMLHYFFFYIGVSNSSGSRSAILDSLGTFFLIILASIFFIEERMTAKKIIGCILGFAGIVTINIGNATMGSGAFTLMGDGMLILSAICSAFGGIITRVVTKKMDPLAATGISLSFGGMLLILTGWMMGGRLKKVTPEGMIVLCLLILVSAIGFSLYNQLLCYNPVGEIAIFNALIPILGAVFSCVLLGERFLIRYLLAGLLVTGGVYIVNSQGREKE